MHQDDEDDDVRISEPLEEMPIAGMAPGEVAKAAKNLMEKKRREDAHKSARSNLLILEDEPEPNEPHCDFCSVPNEFAGDYPIPVEHYVRDHPDEDPPADGENCVIVNDHIVEWL